MFGLIYFYPPHLLARPPQRWLRDLLRHHTFVPRIVTALFHILILVVDFFFVVPSFVTGIIDFATRELLLFIPSVPSSAYRWNGVPPSKEEYKQKYLVDEVHLVSR